MVAMELALLTSMVDAIEERCAAIINVPNTFIQTVVEDKKKQVIIRIHGSMLVDILVKIAPKVYSPFVTTNKRGNQ